MSILPSGLLEAVGDSELLARFIRYSGHYVATKNRIKYAAFLPDKAEDETSVFRVDGLTDLEVSTVGTQNVPSGSFHGMAVIRADVARKQKLEVISAEPPGRHAVFQKWPLDFDEDEQRSKRMVIAMELAERSTYKPKIVTQDVPMESSDPSI